MEKVNIESQSGKTIYVIICLVPWEQREFWTLHPEEDTIKHGVNWQQVGYSQISPNLTNYLGNPNPKPTSNPTFVT